jgi:GT2 family glycosyltransferase
MEDHPNLVLISTVGEVQTIDGESLGPIANLVPPNMYDGPSLAMGLLKLYACTGMNPFNYPSGVMLRTKAFEKCGLFDESMFHIGDTDLYHRIASLGCISMESETGCVVTRHQGQAGNSLGKKPHGLSELQRMVSKLNYLSKAQQQVIRSQLKGLSLLAALSYLLQRDFNAARTFLGFAFDQGILKSFLALQQIIVWRILWKFPWGKRLLQGIFQSSSLDSIK